MDAYVYLRAAAGRVEDVVIALRGRHGVRRATAVVGDWDVMAAVEAADFRSVATAVLRRIQSVEGVTRTYTAPVVPFEMLGVAGGGWPAPPLPMHGHEHACYVHVRVDAGAVVDVVRALAAIEDVSGVAVVAGVYDVIAEIPLPWEQAAPVVLERIHPVPGVRDTTTLIAVPDLEADEDDEGAFPSSWA
ncbi:MAG: Lrp/AsnC ligand binding domain-containing protein [Candidatus Velamenicoccus archaeovorus]